MIGSSRLSAGRDIRYLFMTGVTTDVCVNSTVIAATTRAYRGTAVTDGMASPWPDLHEACLKIWERMFARLRTTDELVSAITQASFSSPPDSA